MDEKVSLEVAENSKKLAEKYIKEENFGRAFSHYLITLKLKPEWKPLLKKDFSLALCKWGTILDNKNKISDLFKCYEQAIEVFPKNEIILNNFGAHLIRCGLLKEAAHYFRECLAIEPHFIRATYNLETVLNLEVERWHFRMLNDNHRNKAFREAILKKINQGFNRVLDIGTGTGILSLFSSEGKASEIYACDSSPAMIEIANLVFKENNTEGIKLISKHSSELKIPCDIPRRISLVVTEILDAGLLGEGILSTLAGAWDNLLLSPCPKDSNLKSSGNFGCVIPFGANVYVVGIECDKISRTLYLKQTGNLFSFENCNVFQSCVNYDSEDLNRVQFKHLTNVEKIFTLNFNDPDVIKEFLQGRRNNEVKLITKERGRLDCFAVWFDLILDEDIVLHTGPESSTNEAWDQAIFSLPKCFSVEEDQEIIIQVSFSNGIMKLRVKCKENYENNFEPSEEVIKTINNEALVKGLREVESKLLNLPKSMRILDSFPFPIFGLNYLIARGDHFEDSLTCFVILEKDRQLLNFLAKKYGLENRLEVVEKHDFENRVEKQEQFDVILLDFVETTGELKDKIVSQIDFLRLLLKPQGIMVPHNVTVIGQFVYSEWLTRMSKVINDKRTCGYKIGKFINTYETRHHVDMDSASIEKICVSHPFELFSLYSDESIFHMTVPCTSSATTINAMFYWFKINLMKNCRDIYTNDESCTYHQSAFLFGEINVPGEIKCKIVRNNDLFRAIVVT